MEIPAHISHLGARPQLQTSLANGRATVDTVEHLLAALRSLGVDNACVELDHSEVPIMDGSSAPWVYLIQDAGVRELTVARKSIHDEHRWVYLDIGLFGGLAEALGEAIKYPIRTPRDGGPVGPVVVAGPTCDSADVLYEEFKYQLPLDLRAGDRVELLSSGAYTTTYSSVGFNGFPPLRAYYLPAR